MIKKLPLNPDSNDIFYAVKDGVLLAKLIEASVPGALSQEKIHMGTELQGSRGVFNVLVNHKRTIEAARKIGCSIVNISAEDLVDGKPYLVFGLLWQIIRAGLLYNVNIRSHPELEQFGADLPAEQLLLKWVNWHLERVGCDMKVKNFGSDFVDSVAYAQLLSSLYPAAVTKTAVNGILQKADLVERADGVVKYAKMVNMSAETFLRPELIVEGHEKLNLCFIASLFNSNSGMTLIHEELEDKIKRLELELGRERNETVDLQTTVDSLNRRVNELQKEVLFWRQEAQTYKKKFEGTQKELEYLHTKFSKSVTDWKNAQEDYESRIESITTQLEGTRSQLKDTQSNLRDQTRQAETFGVCAESLSEELENFRSKQEKLEYLIEHLKQERVRTDQYATTLRTLYKTYANAEALAKSIYAKNAKGKLSLDLIATDAEKTGVLTKKARKGTQWSIRFFVLRDNFLFYYKNEDELRSEPKGVVRLDDCTVQFCRNPTECDLKGQSVIVVNIPDHGHLKEVVSDERTGMLSLYLAGSEYDLLDWKKAVEKASNYWTRKSYTVKPMVGR